MAGSYPHNGDSPSGSGDQQVPFQLRTVIIWGSIALALVLGFAFLSYLRTVYTDLLWYDQLGFRSVFLKILFTRVTLFFIGAIIFGALLGVSLFFAYRFSQGPTTLPIPPEAAALLRRLLILGSILTVLILSVIFGAIFSSRWEEFLRFADAVPFLEADPVYNKDISFYVFTLPIYTFVQGWLLGGAIMTLIASISLYFLNYSLRGTTFEFTPALKVHISIIGAIILLIFAWGHWLDRWELVLSPRGAVVGAAYTDIHASRPALLILTIVAVSCSILMLVNAYTRGLRLLVGAASLWIVMVILLGSVWPALMQQFTVNPNEFVREEQYIVRNIDFTRRGFALNRIEEQFYPAETVVTSQLVRDNPQTINNIRLWDYRPLTDVYTQIQLIRPYYEFIDVDIDRYMINGQNRQVMLAAREVAPEKLEEQSQTWVNRKLFYTHGIGAAMSPVTEFTPEGRPQFFAKDIPATGKIPVGLNPSAGQIEFEVDNPRIYFGENTTDYVIVNTNTRELDYQTQEGDLVRTSYTGDGGVHLSSIIRRAAYAWQMADINILISGEITSDSRIQYRRLIQERISAAAPFLALDSDPYIVATPQQFYWVQDAYTTTDHYPYSDPAQEGHNYMRNSVKVVVDAFNGTMQLYIWDDTDPIIRTYADIFPDLFLQKSEMPEFLSEHVRYPEDFFTIQARKYLKYHMQDPQNFYNNEDLWTIPNEKFGQRDIVPVEPYYVIMKLPEEDREEFVLLLPFTPNTRQNLIGWLAARSDGENYGNLVAFNFPKDRQVDGPEQVEARIDNDQDISAWFTLRCTEGSTCIRGNLLVIPVGNSLLYAEPIYIQAEGVRFPELKRVILATADRVVMEDTLALALASLTGFRQPTGPTNGQGGTTVPLEQIQSELENLLNEIEGIKGDISALEAILERLREITGGE